MNPDLSRRVAKVIDIMMVLGLTIDERMALAHRVELADDFTSLSETDRRAIQAAEKILESGISLAELIELRSAGQTSDRLPE